MLSRFFSRRAYFARRAQPAPQTAPPTARRSLFLWKVPYNGQETDFRDLVKELNIYDDPELGKTLNTLVTRMEQAEAEFNQPLPKIQNWDFYKRYMPNPQIPNYYEKTLKNIEQGIENFKRTLLERSEREAARINKQLEQQLPAPESVLWALSDKETLSKVFRKFTEVHRDLFGTAKPDYIEKQFMVFAQEYLGASSQASIESQLEQYSKFELKPELNEARQTMAKLWATFVQKNPGIGKQPPQKAAADFEKFARAQLGSRFDEVNKAAREDLPVIPDSLLPSMANAEDVPDAKWMTDLEAVVEEKTAKLQTEIRNLELLVDALEELGPDAPEKFPKIVKRIVDETLAEKWEPPSHDGHH